MPGEFCVKLKLNRNKNGEARYFILGGLTPGEADEAAGEDEPVATLFPWAELGS